MRAALLVAVVMAGAVPRADAQPCAAGEPGFERTAGETLVVAFRAEPAPLAVGRHFELEVWVQDQRGGAPTPLPGATVLVSAWMPDHKHGMIRRPGTTDHGDGSYTVEGMLFHMGGHWELFFDLIVDDLSERATFELDL